MQSAGKAEHTGNFISGMLSRYSKWILRVKRSRCLAAAFIVLSVVLFGIACQLSYRFNVELSEKSRNETLTFNVLNKMGNVNHSRAVSGRVGWMDRSLVGLTLRSQEEDFGEEIDVVELEMGLGSPDQKGKDTSVEQINKSKAEPNIVVYNMYQDPGGRFPCVNIDVNPSVPVCLYPEGDDVRVSDTIRKKGRFQPLMLEIFTRALNDDPHLGLIDIGANLGQFSLVAAARMRDVMAIEPHMQHLRRFNKAVYLSNMQRRITVLQNVVSDRRGRVSLYVSKEHPGYAAPLDILKNDYTTPRAEVICLDDVIPYTRFKAAVIVIDDQLYPHRIFARAEKLFAKIDVQFVFMNWGILRFYLVNDYKSHVEMAKQMKKLFQSHGLYPYDPRGMKAMLPLKWTAWSDHLLWAKKSSKLLEMSRLFRNPKPQVNV